MKKILLLAMLAAGFLTAAPAVSAQDAPQRFEVDFFVGTTPLIYWQNNPPLTKYDHPEIVEVFPFSSLARIYEPDPVYTSSSQAYATPYVGIRFGYRVQRWIKVGADVGWSIYGERRYYSDETVLDEKLHTVTVIPKVTFFFATSKYVSAYAGAGLGVAFQAGTPGFDPIGCRPVDVAWQVTPIGITVGRRIPGFTELTVGKDVIGIKFGVGYRF